jgi:hypothetical protein
MHKALAVAVVVAGALASAAQAHGPQDRCHRPRGLLPAAFGWRADAGGEGYNGVDEMSGYAGPEVYGYWSDYGWMGPQYGGWYGPGGWNYYSRTGDYAAPFLPPPSMRAPPY